MDVINLDVSILNNSNNQSLWLFLVRPSPPIAFVFDMHYTPLYSFKPSFLDSFPLSLLNISPILVLLCSIPMLLQTHVSPSHIFLLPILMKWTLVTDNTGYTTPQNPVVCQDIFPTEMREPDMSGLQKKIGEINWKSIGQMCGPFKDNICAIPALFSEAHLKLWLLVNTCH